MTRKPLLLVVALLLSAACGTATRNIAPPGTPQPDKYIFDRATALLNEKKWIEARDLFKQVYEAYTQSPYRPDAKLGWADTYLNEGGSDNLVLAINEYQEFLTYYPTNRRADYAQYKLGMGHFRQMRAPQRDQTETRAAIKEFQVFLDRYPNSALLDDAKARLREARDRLSEADYLVGVFYYRNKWYPGAVDRLRGILKTDEAYSGRDGVYYYLGETMMKLNRPAEALPYYERLLEEFDRGEFLEEARKRVAELKDRTASSAVVKTP